MKADFEKGTKICSKCKRELPISEFGKNKTTKDGLNSWCKLCSSNYNREYCNKRYNEKDIHSRHLEWRY